MTSQLHNNWKHLKPWRRCDSENDQDVKDCQWILALQWAARHSKGYHPDVLEMTLFYLNSKLACKYCIILHLLKSTHAQHDPWAASLRIFVKMWFNAFQKSLISRPKLTCCGQRKRQQQHQVEVRGSHVMSLVLGLHRQKLCRNTSGEKVYIKF